MPKRSILLTIEDEEWNLFKARVSMSGSSMARVFRDFVRKYAAARKPAPVEVPERLELDIAAGPAVDPALLRYAQTFSIPVEGKEKKELLDEVLDAIESDFKESRKSFGRKEFSRYLAGNKAMHGWYGGFAKKP